MADGDDTTTRAAIQEIMYMAASAAAGVTVDVLETGHMHESHGEALGRAAVAGTAVAAASTFPAKADDLLRNLDARYAKK